MQNHELLNIKLRQLKPDPISKGNLTKRYDCAHKCCIKDFKSKKQLIGHHDRLELDCFDERRLLIKL